MKKILYISVCLVFLGIPVFSDSFFDYYDGNPHMIGITIVPLGYYSYAVPDTGAVGAFHFSTHPGGPYKDDPDTTRLPFDLTELGAGVQVYFYF